MRALLVGILVGASMAWGGVSAKTKATKSEGVSKRVAVAIVVDQFAAWIADERLPLLPSTGGFARLRREGTWSHRSEYPYALTETAPGHAALFTGRLPRDNGIVANVVWRSDLTPQTSASLIDDPDADFLVSADKRGLLGERKSVSLHLLKVPTIGNRLLDWDSKATIISISLKDRGAIFAAPSPVAKPGGVPNRGPSPQVQVVWQDEKTGLAVGSAKITDKLPEWATNPDPGSDPHEWDMGHEWFVKKHAMTEDGQEGEDDEMRVDAPSSPPRSFPHRFHLGQDSKTWETFWKRFRATPSGDRWIVDRAIAALASHCGGRVDAAGCPVNGSLLLALSFSTNDYVGHRFGPDSFEAWEELAFLDDQLARLFTTLDRRFGAGGYTVVLSADHGVGLLPEVLAADIPRPSEYDLPRREDGEGKRLISAAIETPLVDDLRSFPGAPKEPLLAAVDDTIVSLHREVFDTLTPEQKDTVRRIVRVDLLKVDGIQRVYDLDTEVCQPGRRRDRDEIFEFVRNSTRCENGNSVYGMFYIVTEKGCYFSRAPYRDSHGTIYRYDRMVPLIVRYADGITRAEVGGATFESFSRALWIGLTGS